MAALNPFEMIGDIELENMCKGWNTKTLLNMSQAYSRVHDVCRNEIIRRESVKERMLMAEEERKRPKPIPRTMYTGPRGGQYYVSPRGGKTYVRQ